MHRNQPLAAFILGLALLSQSGCCCCVTIPTGPQPGDGGESGIGEFVPSEEFPESDEDSLQVPADGLENRDEASADDAVQP